MLGDGQLVAVVPVSDWRAAIPFYRDRLGLTLAEEVPSQNEARYSVGDAILITYQSVGAGKSRHTVAAFVVDDVDAVVADLRARGVEFEEYNLPEIRTEGGIATFGDTREAWFRDPDGNLLAVGTRIASERADPLSSGVAPVYDWLLFLHVLLAFAAAAAMVMFTYLVVAGRSVHVPSDAVRLFRLSRVGDVLINVAMVGLLILGVWMAIDADEYQPWDGWIIAAYVLWAIFAELGRRAQKVYTAAQDRARSLVASGNDTPSAELNAILRAPAGLALQLASIVVFLLFLVDMIFKPGA